MRPIAFTLHVKFTSSFEEYDLLYLLDVRQISLLIFSFSLELSGECSETKHKTFVKILANKSMDTTNEVIGVGSKIFNAPSLCLEI
jgi:hypothetical protein